MSDVLEALAAADEAYREADAAVREIGEDDLERLADVHGEFTDLLERYRGPASGSGGETFQAYVEFEDELVTFVEDLPGDLPERDAFEDAADLLDRRRLEERDFERARDALAPVAGLVSRLEEREDARERYRSARGDVRVRLDELEAEIADLEDALAFADADLDAPVGELRGPVAEYDEAVRDAFAEFRASAPAREVIELIDATDAYPLVPFDPPPDRLRAFLAGAPAGDETIPDLLTYAGYTRSKLAHYVEDPAEFMGIVGANRTYLERLDAAPLTVGWPPPPADELRWRVRELIAAVDRFAPADVLEALREVRAAARDRERYERLRTAARARDELDGDERERLESGALERELESLRTERERLTEALSEYPER